MTTKLEKMREKLNKALELYPSNSEEILRISKILDVLICKSYYKVKSIGQSERK